MVTIQCVTQNITVGFDVIFNSFFNSFEHVPHIYFLYYKVIQTVFFKDAFIALVLGADITQVDQSEDDVYVSNHRLSIRQSQIYSREISDLMTSAQGLLSAKSFFPTLQKKGKISRTQR